MSKLLIFGTGDIAQLAKYYFETDSEHTVIAFTVDDKYVESETFEKLPLIPFSQVESRYSPEEYKMFIAISYAKMNRLRESKFLEAKAKGYVLVSYISSRCSYLSQFQPGDNCFILEDNTVQPFVKIGDNVTLWSGNHIGHHSEIGDNNFISSQVVISGHCIIGSNCFLGVNCTIGHQVTIGEQSLIGAGATITKNTKAKSVYVPSRSMELPRSSEAISI